jgi:2-amino-4-hydroxy-6-hydroxymethyldihydropteridine diphosphokinase
MNTAYLILGSNVGNRLKNIKQATTLISVHAGTIIKKSDIYETGAWGNTNQPDFLNQALYIETLLSAPDLLEILLSIEQQLGRMRDGQKWMERTMDIDILFFNSDIINTPELKIPHPYIHERMFVLVPMAQIAADFIHPLLNKSIVGLLADCQDTIEITKLPAL